ncbi:MarR family transcriptional regulator [Heyndrickxia coagulans]|uniref:MarR family winged helix-turn-helix transcriptional regulator n=1 Tax=Heyndrickxia coagulans TaxID=1398 RepID=UPI002E2454CF|nr:MarR family transcriptional regulator [Heyndrickxia coagulans]MED4935133.1 MarR family transcriptional regulator [Heyndrickxia coagulans]
MKKDEILDKLLEITHQPFLIFVNAVEEKTDNAFETLKLLAAEENVTAGRISEVLDIKPSSVTQIIKKLEEAGTARREKSEQDSRVTIVKMTDKGRESLKERSSISTTLKDVLFQGFAEDELEMLDQYLERMVSNISSEAFHDKLHEVFSNDKRWELFGKMSARFGRAREQMLERSGFGGFGSRGFMGGGFDGWKKGRKR